MAGYVAGFERVASGPVARIERDMVAILQVLAEHSRMLERLPEAVHDKVSGRESTVSCNNRPGTTTVETEIPGGYKTTP